MQHKLAQQPQLRSVVRRFASMPHVCLQHTVGKIANFPSVLCKINGMPKNQQKSCDQFTSSPVLSKKNQNESKHLGISTTSRHSLVPGCLGWGGGPKTRGTRGPRLETRKKNGSAAYIFQTFWNLLKSYTSNRDKGPVASPCQKQPTALGCSCGGEGKTAGV